MLGLKINELLVAGIGPHQTSYRLSVLCTVPSMIETPIYKILEAAAGASSSVSSAASSISKSAVRLPIPRVSINVYLLSCLLKVHLCQEACC